MKEVESFIENVFIRQHESILGNDIVSELQGEHIYLSRFDNFKRIGALHAYRSFENIHIKGLAILEAYQKQGLGKSMLLELEGIAQSKSVTSITLSTKSFQAKDLYIKLGYEVYACLENVPFKETTKYHLVKYLR